MEYWFAPRASTLRRTKSSTSLNASSDTSSQKNRNKYNDKNCEIFLRTKGTFLNNHKDGISSNGRVLCRDLLRMDHEIPIGTLFDDHAFELSFAKIRNKNETEIIRIIGELIVPSAESAISRGYIAFKRDISINEAWDNSLSLDANPHSSQAQEPLQPPPPPQASKLSRFQLPRPQPDYAVGYSWEAFTEDQLRRLTPFRGDIGDPSFFMGTADMHFPFFTSEVKGKAALHIAD